MTEYPLLIRRVRNCSCRQFPPLAQVSLAPGLLLASFVCCSFPGLCMPGTKRLRTVTLADVKRWQPYFK